MLNVTPNVPFQPASQLCLKLDVGNVAPNPMLKSTGL